MDPENLTTLAIIVGSYFLLRKARSTARQNRAKSRAQIASTRPKELVKLDEFGNTESQPGPNPVAYAEDLNPLETLLFAPERTSRYLLGPSSELVQNSVDEDTRLFSENMQEIFENEPRLHENYLNQLRGMSFDEREKYLENKIADEKRMERHQKEMDKYKNSPLNNENIKLVIFEHLKHLLVKDSKVPESAQFKLVEFNIDWNASPVHDNIYISSAAENIKHYNNVEIESISLLKLSYIGENNKLIELYCDVGTQIDKNSVTLSVVRKYNWMEYPEITLKVGKFRFSDGRDPVQIISNVHCITPKDFHDVTIDGQIKSNKVLKEKYRRDERNSRRGSNELWKQLA